MPSPDSKQTYGISTKRKHLLSLEESTCSIGGKRKRKGELPRRPGQSIGGSAITSRPRREKRDLLIREKGGDKEERKEEGKRTRRETKKWPH